MKKILLVFMFVCLFFSSFTNVHAASGSPFDEPVKVDEKEYPYRMVLAEDWKNPDDLKIYARYIYFIYSKNPITITKNHAGIYLHGDGKYIERSISPDGSFYVGHMNDMTHFIGFGTSDKSSNLIYSSNHDIYYEDGSLAFQNPQTPVVPPVQPEQDWTKTLINVFLKILGMVIGGMILLILFFLLLRLLPRLLKNFGMR